MFGPEDNIDGLAAATTTSCSQHQAISMAHLAASVQQQANCNLQTDGPQQSALAAALQQRDIHHQGDVRLIIAGYLRESPPPSELSIIARPIVIENNRDDIVAGQTPSASAAITEQVSELPSQYESGANFSNSIGADTSQFRALSIGGDRQPLSGANQPRNQDDIRPSSQAPPVSAASQHHQHHYQHSPQWQMMLIAARQGSQVRQRVSMAGDQLGASLRQLYASASSIAADLPPSYHNIPGIVPYYHGRSSGPPPSYDDVVNPYAPPPSYQSLFGQMLEARKRSRGFLDLLRRLLIISTLGCTILIAFMILVPFTMIIIGAIYLDECKVEHIPAFLLVGGLIWASKNIIHCYAQCQPDQFQADHEHGHSDTNGSGSAISTTATTTTTATTDLTNGTMNGDQIHLHSYTNSINGTGAGATVMSEQQQQQEALNLPPPVRRRRLKSSICESLLNCILLGWFIAGCVIVFRNYEPDFDNPSSARYCNRTVYMYTFWLITTAILMVGLFVGCICCLMVSSAIASRQEDDLR